MDTTIMSQDQSGLKSRGKLSSRGILVVLSENHFGTAHIVDSGICIVGRSDKADFTIKDDLISREHCRILRDGEGFFHIEDLKSTNSITVNGKKLKKARQLCYGDKICLGDTILRFFREETPG